MAKQTHKGIDIKQDESGFWFEGSEGESFGDVERCRKAIDGFVRGQEEDHRDYMSVYG